MSDTELTSAKAIAKNLDALMKRHGLNQSELAKLSGVSQRHISDILKEKTECGIEKANKLAKPFKLQGWQLQMPDLPEDLLDSETINKVIKALVEASPEGRDLIAKLAEREAHYSKR